MAGSVVIESGSDPKRRADVNSNKELTVIDSGANTKLGSITETAPTTDTASSGLNGRLQRIAQRLTSLIALLPSSIGQKTMDGSLSVVVASDQTVPTRTEPQRGAIDQNNFSIFAEGVNAQTTETPLLSIDNPSNSGKTLYIYSICNFVDPANNNFCKFRYYNNCTGVSGGSTVTPTNLYSGSSTSSVVTVKSLPTITTLSGKLTGRAGPAGNTQGSIYNGELLQGYWIIPPGKIFVITGSSKANNTPTFIGVEVIEK